MLPYLWLLITPENKAAGNATIIPMVQMSVILTKSVLWDFLGASGVIMAYKDSVKICSSWWCIEIWPCISQGWEQEE